MAKKKTTRKKHNESPEISPAQCVCIVESLIYKTENTNYGNQMVMARRLIKKYGFEFLRFVGSSIEGKKTTTLASYMTDKGKELLRRYKIIFDNFNQIKNTPKKDFTLEENPLYLVEEKVRATNQLDFFKNYGKKENK